MMKSRYTTPRTSRTSPGGRGKFGPDLLYVLLLTFYVLWHAIGGNLRSRANLHGGHA